MNQALHAHLVLFLMFIFWLGLGLFFLAAWVVAYVLDTAKAAPAGTRMLTPFTAGRLYYAADAVTPGAHRADAFGVKMAASDPLPKPNEKLFIHTGTSYQLFTVLMCETMTLLASGDPEKDPGFVRSPEVYILVREKLSDETILRVKRVFGPGQEFDPKYEARKKPKPRALKVQK